MHITRTQVISFLDEVRSFAPLPEDQVQLTPGIEKLAGATEELLARHFRLAISRDRPGVILLDELLNAMHYTMQPPAMEYADLVCASIGTLLGEVFRGRVPGTWQFAKFQGKRYVALVTEGGTKYAPIQKAGKQFLHGQQDSVLALFGLGLMFAERRARLEKWSPEEREALKQRAKKTIERRKAEARAKQAQRKTRS